MQSRRHFLRVIGSSTLATVLVGTGGACGAAPFQQLLQGADYLVKGQSTDGAWRSTQYGFFRNGDALTPLILLALHSGPQRVWQSEALERGTRWLNSLTDNSARSGEPWQQLRYPLFTASYAARFYHAVGDPVRARIWANWIAALQLTSAHHWPVDDPHYGGWSDAPMLPQRPADGTVPDMLNPNVSATALAAVALATTGHLDRARLAEGFIGRCQNFSTEPDPSTRFDDGGFIFALNDPVRNKAGVAGRDRLGRTRFRSYGSATCDGVMALLALGQTSAMPRVAAGLRWLRDRCAKFEHPGAWPADRADSGRALHYYYAQALAQVLATGRDSWMAAVRRELVNWLGSQQSAEGFWRNADPESCEDDPLVATAFAMHALSLLM